MCTISSKSTIKTPEQWQLTGIASVYLLFTSKVLHALLNLWCVDSKYDSPLW